MLGSSLPSVVCMRTHVLLRYLCLFSYAGVQHTFCCVFVLFFFALCTLCCHFLWIVHFWLPLQYSLTFMFKSRFQCVSLISTCFLPWYGLLVYVDLPKDEEYRIYVSHFKINLCILTNNKNRLVLSSYVRVEADYVLEPYRASVIDQIHAWPVHIGIRINMVSCFQSCDVFQRVEY